MKRFFIKSIMAMALICSAMADDPPPALFAESDPAVDVSMEAAALQELLSLQPTTKRARIAVVNTMAFDSDSLTLNVFPGHEVVVDKRDIGFTGARHRTWLGKVRDGFGSVSLIINGKRISGKLTTEQGSYEIFPMNDGNVVITESNPAGFKDCGDCSEPHGSLPAAPTPEEAAQAEALQDDPLGDTPTVNRVRVIVGYTSGAQANTLSLYNRTMLEHVELAVVESNQGYANSLVAQRMELAYLYEVSYSEVGGNLQTDVNRLQNPSDGFMDEIHTLRNLYDADMCAVIQDGSSSFCGRAYGFDYTDDANMFQVSEYQCIVGNYTFAHEFGHTQGCRHDTDGTLTPFAYGHGFRQGNTTWRTIMAVTGGNSATRLNYWSNPNVNSPVSPFVAMGTVINGGNFAQDNESALDVGDFTVVNHRTTPATFTLSDTIGNDEFADMITTDALTVQNYTANSGSTANLRAPNKVELKSGFHARAGSTVRVFRGSVDGTEF